MTDEGPMDEGQMSEPPQPGEMPAAGGQASPLSDIADFSTGEGLVAFAGLIILASWVLFTVILNGFYYAFPATLFAAIAVVVPRLKPETVAKVMPTALVMKLTGYGLAFIGIVDLIEDIRFEYINDAVEIIGAIIAAVAYLMAFFGARQIKT